MNEEDFERKVEKLIAEGIPNVKEHRGAVELCEMLSQYSSSVLGEDPHEHLYKYAIAAICTMTVHIQNCVNKGPLEGDDIYHIIMLAFSLGRMRGEALGLLEAMKTESLGKFGRMTKEELLGKIDITGLLKLLDSITDGSSNIKVVHNLEELLRELFGKGHEEE